MKKIIYNIFSIRRIENHKVLTIFGIKIKLKRYNDNKQLNEEIYNNILMSLFLKLNYIKNKDKKFCPIEIFSKIKRPLNNCYFGSNISYIEYCCENLTGSFDPDAPIEKNPDFYYICGINSFRNHIYTISNALKKNQPVYIIEDGFLRSVLSHVYRKTENGRYFKSIGFTLDDITHYVDCSIPSRLELWLNDKNLLISEKQKARARKCIDRILETHLSKYNNQPIYKPEIGLKGNKKILVIDQAKNDMSIIKGNGSEEIFETMLHSAIHENPGADIIIKIHPETSSGFRDGYYTALKNGESIFLQNEPIDPISLLKYVDKVYVCTSQMGLEALLCAKEVHVFGIPFYSGWGLTQDYQKCERRTNTRTIEELFYIVYIMYTIYVNPVRKCICEIEEAMDYLLQIRDEYLNT